ERLKRTETEYFIENLFDDAVALWKRHRNVLLQKQLLDSLADLTTQTLFADQPQRLAVQRLKQLAVNFRFDVGVTLRKSIARWMRERHRRYAGFPAGSLSTTMPAFLAKSR